MFIVLFSSFNISVDKARAQLPVTDAAGLSANIGGTIWQKITRTLGIVLQKAGSMAFQQVLRSALNKIAYDTANYLGSGGQGQKPMFISNPGEYLTNIGDEALGQFVESFVGNLNAPVDPACDVVLQECQAGCMGGYGPVDPSNTDPNKPSNTGDTTCLANCKSDAIRCATRVAPSGTDASGTPLTSNQTAINQSHGQTPSSFNVCAPSSLEAKLKIGLGLAEQSRPTGPNCTASAMYKNWETGISNKINDWKDPNYLDKFASIFDPRSNDMGIYLLARTDASSKAIIDTKKGEDAMIKTKGWIETTDIAGNLIAPPGEAEKASNDAKTDQKNQFGKTTGDILVDTANIFLNQLFMSAFTNLMGSLGKKTTDINKSLGGVSVSSSYQSDPNIVYGEPQLKEITSRLLTPNFGSSADYDILSELAICLDSANPGPTNCVVDDKFVQGVSEKKTVIEAIKGGYLHGDWIFTSEPQANSYSSSYNLRNISILRQYRILPVGWEEAAKQVGASTTTKTTLMDLVSCFDGMDEYNQFSNGFNKNDQGWCRGLVDPSWVLKAPANYCKKQGVSAQVMNKDQIPGMKGNAGVPDTLSTLSLTRAEEYCADNQSCIKEKSNGSCEVYGYCNEEKRTWNFGDDSCNPNYNTCQSFVNTSNKQSISYLQNTLDYGSCTPESAGCKRYSTSGTYSTSTGTVSWSNSSVNPDNDIYLNRSTKTCTNKDEGCTELIRVKPTWGANLVMNSDFVNEDDFVGASSTGNKLNDWPLFSSGTTGGHKATIVDASLEPGGEAGKALKLESTGVVSGQIVVKTFSEINSGKSLVPTSTQTIIGQSYTLSADVYLSGGSHAYLILGADTDGFVATSTIKNSWQHMTVTRRASSTYSLPDFSIHGDSNTSEQVVIYIKNIKLEVSNWDTGYSSYGAAKIYEKVIPKYLESVCYAGAPNNYKLAANAPSVCSSFARRCNKDEVGCELYKSVKNNFTVSAQVQDTDYCPGECLGYDTYITKETYFNNSQEENLIPATATSCSAAAAGCNEFTNLDEVSQGGESREYYTRLKQCIKPGSDCASFYAWEGTNNGYQLKAYSLKQDISGGPEVTGTGSECSARIYNLTIGDPEYNPDCVEFYNSAGAVFYRLSSLVITCSENCHAYRMTNSVAPCMNAGEDAWSTTHNACIYWAIPGEGRTCSAPENGCREYNGNNGNNTRVVARFNFENGGGGWYSNCPGGVVSSTISNNKNGHSLMYTNSTCGVEIGEGDSQAKAPKLPIIKELLAANSAAQLKVNGLVSTGKSYSLKFIATANSSNPVNLQIYFKNVNAATTSAFTSVTIAAGTDWAVYETNLNNLDHEIGESEVLVVTGNGSFYFDDLILTEITDRYYLIKGSAVTPDICSYDVYDNYVGPIYNLGCSQYTDRSNIKSNIHRFSKLCNGESVGCEQMILTNNYNAYGGGTWKDKNVNDPDPLEPNGACDPDEPSCVKIGSHQMIYAIYDATKKCNASMKGCSRLGEGRGTTTNMVWSDVFKKNDPNEYDKILCSQDELGCDEWQNVGGNGYSYFKDPGNEACVYRAANSTSTVEKAWYKIPVKRCDLAPNTPDGKITVADLAISSSTCTTAADCEDEKPCIVDNNDYFCATSTLKTIGYGGQGNQIQTPSSTAALCVPASSGCTEYIDPISQFSPNLVKNPDYLKINGVREGWIGSSQDGVVIEPNKLYIFGISSESGSNSGDVTLQFTRPVKILLSDNTFSTSTNTLELTITTGPLRHILFNSMSNTSMDVVGGAEGKTIEVRAAVVDYQQQNNIDKKTCNGLVDFGKGCVLFNERTINGSKGLTSLASGWDAYSTLVGKSPASCDVSSSGSCNSNTLLKVQPNRICSKWLDCSSYIIDPTTKERVCYAAEECTRLNDKNECDNFIYADTSNRVFNSKTDRNATGYSLLDKYYVGQMNEVGIDSDAHYDFEESIPALSCRRAAPATGECNFNKNIIIDSLVREPVGSPVDYPAHGKTYLKVPTAYEISPTSNNNWISVIPGRDYYLNYLVNTKNSVTGAKITILFKDGTSNSAVVTANNGWERKIFKFSSGVNKLIKIYLGADVANAQGFVYFDDLNIEPVLQIGNNAYVARECRLYPASDSLTCRSKNNQVIQDGWEGYCLEHDANNPNVCLLWYPVDKISSAKTGLSALGYSGKFPLNYCTKADGNFSLVEKRIPKVVQTFGCWGNFGYFGGSDADKNHFPGGYNLRAIYAVSPTEIESWYHDKAQIIAGPNEITSFCGPNSIGNYWLLIRPHGNFTEHERGYYSLTCMPAYLDSKGFLVKSEQEIALIPKMSACDYSDNDYYTSDVKVDGYTGWYQYNGFSSYTVPLISAESNFTSPVDETKNADPPIRVWDYDNIPADEEGLKLVSGSDRERVFNITCNSFTQLVDYDGQNKAWAYRTSKDSIFSTSTPDFFWYGATNLYSASPFLLNLYGRNRQDTPFGAAAWDDSYDLLNSEPIEFSNQYSKKDNQTVFAGRPYGCDNGTLGSGCYNMGQCSLNPNVFCLYSTFPSSSSYDLNKKSCADGGYGTCIRLWAPGKYLGMDNTPDYDYILRSIFLKPYNSFSYNPGLGFYTTDNLSFPDYSLPTEPLKNPCPGGTRTPDNSFCAVYPTISNVVMKFNGVKKTDGGGLKFEIKNKGIYSLEFNTEVDKEQQPLKRIEIIWGDGTTQVITGQDNRSSITNPHIFYHYYVPTFDMSQYWYEQIEINVYDNWGFYKNIGG